MHILLTGATGFIGAQVARRLLHEGCSVSVLVRAEARLDRIADILPQLQCIEGDLLEPDSYTAAVRAAPPDVCIHLAWYAVPGQYLQAHENLACVSAGLALLEILHSAGCPRAVFVGTCFEYDTRYGYLSETTPARPGSLYAACKHSLYLMAAQFQAQHGLSFAWPRLFYQYGPWEDERRLVPWIIGKLLAGQPCPLTVGTQIRDYLHITDVAGALWAVAQGPLEGPVNIGAAQPITVAALAQQIGD
ncbi:MAG: NAD-dependent epimerase/dehydratase family protein, partial [Chloroflexota bacterium]|nr:NAD-dependent epimerase/dehydratase family protein [Chloroflexota bacterium]